MRKHNIIDIDLDKMCPKMNGEDIYSITVGNKFESGSIMSSIIGTLTIDDLIELMSKIKEITDKQNNK